MNRTTIPSIAFTAIVLATHCIADPMPALAQATPVQPEASATMTDGEIRKVDKEAKKVTIRHAEIRHLDMPAMSMVFQVKDPALLDVIKAGDKVRFGATKENDVMFVTEIQAAQ